MTARFRHPRRRAAFTLNELLIVIAIIVLMLGLAVPAFNALTGSKSVEGATNQISAVLGQARAEAIGLQEVRGVMFFIDPRTGRTNIAIVHSTPAQTGDNGITYLDLVADRDFTALPVVGIQTIDNATTTGTAPVKRSDDGYIGYNKTAQTVGVTPGVQYGGVILFDAYGKLISTQYAFRCVTTTAPVSATGMGSFMVDGTLALKGDTAGTYKDFIPGITGAAATFSQVGFAAYSKEPYDAAGYTLTDPQFTVASGTLTATYGDPGSANLTDEAHEEGWIDSNAQLFLVNRYNGTLVKGD